MKTTIKFMTLLAMTLVLALSSCTKDGEIGPAGPAGPAGIDGIDGTNGENGNANVVSVLLEDQTIENGTNTYDFPELTQSIFDTGVVLGYVKVSSSDFWESLPLAIAGDIALDIDKIEVERLTLLSTFTQSGLNLRFIFIEGTSSTGKTSHISILDELKAAGVDINNYDQVIDYFGLDY